MPEKSQLKKKPIDRKERSRSWKKPENSTKDIWRRRDWKEKLVERKRLIETMNSSMKTNSY
jgi:hypothetical protein